MIQPLLAKLKAGLIVSCQAPADSPLHNPTIIAAIAEAAIKGGAVGVRIDTPAHIQAVRQQLPTTPIIGLWKQSITGYEVYITPSSTSAAATAEAGANIVAIDATLRERPGGENVAELIKYVHQLGKLVMADVDSLENAVFAANAGADIVGTTLYGYTAQTRHLSPPGFSLLLQLVDRLNVPAICEGGIATPQMAKQALKLGAYAVVVGTAITGIDAQVKAFQSVFN